MRAGVVDEVADARERGRVDQRADLRLGVARIADGERPARAASSSANGSATARSTTMRSVDMQIWP